MPSVVAPADELSAGYATMFAQRSVPCTTEKVLLEGRAQSAVRTSCIPCTMIQHPLQDAVS
jgi:hypothetical protein